MLIISIIHAKANEQKDPFRLWGSAPVYKNFDARGKVMRRNLLQVLAELGQSNEPLTKLL